MHDTLDLFGSQLRELRELWRQTVAPQIRAGDRGTISAAAEKLFGNISDDILRAARIPENRALSPEAIRNACQYGFIQVFG